MGSVLHKLKNGSEFVAQGAPREVSPLPSSPKTPAKPAPKKPGK